MENNGIWLNHIQIQEKDCLSKRFSRGKIGLDGTRSNVISFRVEHESLNWQRQKISEKEVLNRTHLWVQIRNKPHPQVGANSEWSAVTQGRPYPPFWMFLAVQVIVLKQFYAYQWRYDKGCVIYRKTFIKSRYIGTIQVIDKIIDTKSRIVKLSKNYWYQEMCQIIMDKYIWKTKLISVLFLHENGG